MMFASLVVDLAFLVSLFIQNVVAETPDSSPSSSAAQRPDLRVGPRPRQIKNLITFGDSYTDTVVTGDGGTAWPVYAAGYANLRLFPFARSGATCSNNLTFRPFPSVFESQIPAFLQERERVDAGGSGSLRRVKQEETVYTLWIGMNDVGSNALLTGGQAEGVSVVDTTACAVDWVKTMYGTGARNFIFQNMIPLEHTILYSPSSYPNRFWTAQRNTTEWSLFTASLTQSGNALAKFMLQNLAPTLKGAHVGLFDSHQLFTDMVDDPTAFLNGTVPINTTGAVQQCVFALGEDAGGPGECTVQNGTDRDSFLWFDELHPSEQADRVVARNIANAIVRLPTKYITWLS